jgi:hypothetical protein
VESLATNTVPQWSVFERCFTSETHYESPLHEVRSFRITFTAPSGRQKTVSGFWNGELDWRVRFMPSEVGTWHYRTQCTDADNAGLHQQEGQFVCEPNPSPLALYQHGSVGHRLGERFLRHADGTPFFYTACTAWNGPLKSTEAEWSTYLAHRAEHHYTAIQFVTTQWRGGATNSQLQTAYTGRHRIAINPAFFQHLDRKIDEINAHGLLAAPVLLWALPFGAGRSLSPGVTLPRNQAVLLAQYIVARYGGHHVLWLLGGDGYYLSVYARRWKRIGRQVFEGIVPTDNVPAFASPAVALHPMGRSWIGEAYAKEPWLNVVGYQSGHGTDRAAVEFVTRGPVARTWAQLPARPTINMEPCYEELRPEVDAEAVRNASYRSVFATPPAGITYGANGIWPWIRPGERILNHGALSQRPVRSWRESVDLPGSKQVGYLAQFMQQFRWWELVPDNTLLTQQPGDEDYRRFVSVLRSNDYRTVLVYLPTATAGGLHNPQRLSYRLRWFDPVANIFSSGKADGSGDTVRLVPPGGQDAVAVLEN